MAARPKRDAYPKSPPTRSLLVALFLLASVVVLGMARQAGLI